MSFFLQFVVAFSAYAAIATTSEFNASQLPETQEVGSQADCDNAAERDRNSRRKLNSHTIAPLEVHVGGTLSLSSWLAWDDYQTERARYTYNGYKLLQEVVNGEGIFTGRAPVLTVSGRPLKIFFHIEDDHLDLQRSRRLYERMIDLNEVDYYVGPIGNFWLTQAAYLTNASGAFMFVSASSSRHLMTYGFPYLFSTDFFANTSLVSTLDILRQKGAQTLVITWQTGLIQRYRHECQGAWAHANATGWIVRWHWTLNHHMVASDIRTCQSYKPDVLVACTDMEFGTNLLVHARAFNLNLKALVMTQAGNANFVETVTPSNAIFVYAPVPWHWDAPSHQDPFFTSALGFKAAWDMRFGEYPEFHGAAAAAAGMAFVLALQQLDKIATPAELRQHLLGMNAQTFFHRLQFTSNGVLADQSYNTVQVKEFTGGTDLEKYRKSKLVVVSASVPGIEEPHYPSPSWELKESMIYPCPVGHVMNQSSENNLTCIGCQPGRARPRSILHCMRCPMGRYNDEEGLEQCKSCPRGGDCSARGVVNPGSSYGDYLLDSGVYIVCHPPELCLGNNQCIDNNDGVMCASCKLGYTVRGLFAQSSYKCSKCPSTFTNAFLLLFAIGVWFAIVVLVGYLTVSSSTSVKSMHSIILKKMVNHMQLIGTAWSAGEFNDLFNLKLFAGLSSDPLQQVVSLDCLLRGAGVALYEATTYIGLTLIPLALALNTGIFALNFSMRVRAFKQEMQDANEDKKEAAEKKKLEKKVKKERGKIGKTQDGDKVEEATMHNAEDSSSESDMETAQLVLKHKWLKLQDKSMFYVQWSIVWVFVLHPIVVKLLLDGIRCDELDVFRLNFDYNILCHSFDHQRIFYFCIAGVGIYGIGIPLLFFFLLYRVRHRLMHLRVRKLFGFLYNGFEAPWYFFEILYMLRKVFLLLLAVIPVLPLRIGAMLVTSFIFLALHIFCSPYDNRDFFVLDRLETTSLISLVLILQTKMFYILREISTRDTFISDVVWAPFWNYCLWTLVAIVNIYFWILALSSLVRNSVLKYIHLKSECGLDRVNCFERLLLRLDNRHHQVVFRSQSNTLDMMQLTKEEKYFLQSTLWDTISVYLDSDKHFHGGLLLTCVKRAFQLCIQDREYRKKNMLTILVENEDSDQGWSSRLKMWQAQLANVTDTGRGLNPDKSERTTRKPGNYKKPTKAQVLLAEYEQNYEKQDHTEMKATVEELQNALMLCWPDIIIHTPRFFVLEKPPPEIKALSADRTTTNMLDDLLQNLHHSQVDTQGQAAQEAQDFCLDEKRAYDKENYEEAVKLKLKQRDQESAIGLTPEDIEDLNSLTEKALPTSTVQLRRRHVQVTQELWLSKVELHALREHEQTLTKTGISDDYLESDNVDAFFKKQSTKDDDNDFYSEQTTNIKKSAHLVKVDLKIDVSFLSDNHKESLDSGQKLVEIVKSIRDMDMLPIAVDTLIYGTRIVALHFARHSALDVPDGGEIAGSSTNPFAAKHTGQHPQLHYDPEAKVIASLKEGQGWNEISKHSLHAVDNIKHIAQKLRAVSTDVEDKYAKEANGLEAWLLNASRGLVSGKGFVDGVTEMDEHDLLGWRAAHNARFEGRLAHLLEHLKLLNRDDEAEDIAGMVDRLFMMGHMAVIKHHNDEETTTPSLSREKYKEGLKDRVKEDWEEMGPVAVEAVETLEKVASTLEREGLEEESFAVSGMIDELVTDLLAIYHVSVTDEEEIDNTYVGEALGVSAAVDNGAGVLL